jgi:hypothetical protein
MRVDGWTAGEESKGRDDRVADAPARPVERRAEPRYSCSGLKLIIRQRRALGIIHLRNLSHWGASGITDLPVAPGSLVFLELKKGHFYGARVKWVHRFALGVQFARKLAPETLRRLLDKAAEEREAKLRALQ